MLRWSGGMIQIRMTERKVKMDDKERKNIDIEMIAEWSPTGQVAG